MLQDLELLRKTLGSSKVLSDPPAITAYSIDAGIYKIPPLAVVLIDSPEDMERIMIFSRRQQVPLTARSGGTNLAGNAIGPGVVLDFSRLNRILELNEEEGWARVEPGIIYAELNRELARKGWMFAPDPSSGDACKIGGMIGNNAAGPHTLKYGAVKDNLLGLSLLLPDGAWLTAREYRMDDPAFIALQRECPGVAETVRLVADNLSLILEKKKKVSKNASGYNLFGLAEGLQRGVFPLHLLFTGSEGTLALVREATLRLVRRPSETATALFYFRTLREMSRAVREILPLGPSALEMMDQNTLNLVGREKHGIPPDAEAMLLAEFDSEARVKMGQVRETAAGYHLCVPLEEAFDTERQLALWRARKAINPALYRYDSRKKPIHFVDDVVVPPDRIPDLIPYLEKAFAEKGVKVAIYGHIGDGNAHVNPLLNLNDPADFQKMTDLSREIHTTVIEKFGGSLCGEHGDGRVRAEFLEALYGPEIYALFKRIKRVFDPENLMNPGVKISSERFTGNIDYERYAKSCATCGKCNTVCPVYDATGEESNAARGWFHILTAKDYSYDLSGRAVEACLNCKSCRSVCPAGIDVSGLVLEKRGERPNKTAGKIFALQARERLFRVLLKGLAWTQPIWDIRPGRILIEALTRPFLKGLAPTARIPAEMVLPRLARRHLRERYDPLTRGGGPVAYFHGCAANYFDDGVGDAVVSLLRKRGFEPALPPQRCSGTPIQTYGLTDRLKEAARFNLTSLGGFKTVVTGCASCTLMLKDYPSLFPEGEELDRAKDLAARVVHISEFLVRNPFPPYDQGALPKIRVTCHSSCHLRVSGGSEAPITLLRDHPGFDYVKMADAERCAGGAGTFCVKNPEQSALIFQRKKRAILESGAEVVATSCPACMIQLKNGLRGSVKVKHIAQLLDGSSRCD